MTRAAVRPRGDRTIHLIGDPHARNLVTRRKNQIVASLADPNVPTPAAHVVCGDWTVDGTELDYTSALAFKGLLSNAPAYGTIGNHEIEDDILTPQEAMTALGLGDRTQTVDLGFVTLVIWYPGDSYTVTNSGSRASVGSLAALDSILASTSGDVWIVCHYPLYNTHLGDVSTHWRSVDSGYFAASMSITADSSDVEAIIAGHANVKAWLSAHTHTAPSTASIITTKSIGGRAVACINASTPLPPNKDPLDWGECNTLWLTHTGSAIEVRVRNHGAGIWHTFGSQGRVVTVTPT